MKTAWQRPRSYKAKKVHTCDWCQTPIIIGETYTYWFGLTDYNDLGETHAHNDCWEAMEREASESGGWEDIDWVSDHLRGMTTEETEKQGALKSDTEPGE